MQGQTDLNLEPEQLATETNVQLLFLLKILQLVSDSDHDENVVYPLLKQKIELLNEKIIEILRTWVEDIFTKVDEDKKKSIAINIGNFGVLIHDFRLGNISVNLEIAITCYEIFSTFFTIAKYPKMWAANQTNIANAYSNRIRGDRANNIEKAIDRYQAALSIHTIDAFPQDWAVIQNSLAVAYTKRIRGDRANNIEKAIDRYQAALTIHTLDDFPQYWATIQNNLAAAYNDRIKGDIIENIEKAIDGFHLALMIRTPEAFPQPWAETQNNLAEVYSARIAGELSKNLQQALDYYQHALEVLTINSFPNEWVSIQLKLAKLSIEKMHNYQMAMEHLEAAYEHLSVNNNDTGLLAQTMFDMARCFHQTGSLDQAKIHFKDAIRIYQRLEQPTEVAAATSALGNLELQMGLTQDAQQHLQTALEFYQAAGQTDHIASIQALQQHLPIKLREIAS
jgi:tetratricopeptide (TPR) repeat protein